MIESMTRALMRLSDRDSHRAALAAGGLQFHALGVLPLRPPHQRAVALVPGEAWLPLQRHDEKHLILSPNDALMVISAGFGRGVPAAPLARRPASPDRLAAQRQRGVSAAVDGAGSGCPWPGRFGCAAARHWAGGLGLTWCKGLPTRRFWANADS
jgi:hypothetical protein